MIYGNVPLRFDDDPARANSTWWTNNAADYLAEHGEILGDADFIWGPEGLREADIEFLGELRSSRVLEIGAGAAQCSRFLHGKGVDVVATDVSSGMVSAGLALNDSSGCHFPIVEADARELPFDDGSFDVVFTSFGVLPFIPDLDAVNSEVHRVLRPGGTWAYSAMHPVRWMFPDDPTTNGLTVTRSYFERNPYVERSDRLEYAEFHHSLTDHVNSLSACGFRIDEMFEPPWPAGRDIVWGGWGPERSPIIPGTLMVRAEKL